MLKTKVLKKKQNPMKKTMALFGVLGASIVALGVLYVSLSAKDMNTEIASQAHLGDDPYDRANERRSEDVIYEQAERDAIEAEKEYKEKNTPPAGSDAVYERDERVAIEAEKNWKQKNEEAAAAKRTGTSAGTTKGDSQSTSDVLRDKARVFPRIADFQ